MPQFKTLRHLGPKPTIKVYTPNNPRKPAAVKLALKLQTKTMAQLCRIGRRLVSKMLRTKALDNGPAWQYYGARFKQVAAEHRFRITKKT